MAFRRDTEKIGTVIGIIGAAGAGGSRGGVGAGLSVMLSILARGWHWRGQSGRTNSLPCLLVSSLGD
jgi:hypothetical protein